MGELLALLQVSFFSWMQTAFFSYLVIILKNLSVGDVNSISVGSGTNIQDNSLVHVAKSNLSGKVLPTIIGDNVTVGEWYVGDNMHDVKFGSILFWIKVEIWTWQVIVLLYMAVLLRMRPLLVWEQYSLMVL
jgi:hypothetical protein